MGMGLCPTRASRAREPRYKRFPRLEHALGQEREESIHRRKMSAHALLKMTRDLFRAMSLALRQKYPRNVVEMKEAIAAFFGSDSVAISCHCKRSKIFFIKVLTEVCSLENIASWNWRKIAVAWSDSVLLTLRSQVCMWKTCRKGG